MATGIENSGVKLIFEKVRHRVLRLFLKGAGQFFSGAKFGLRILNCFDTIIVHLLLYSSTVVELVFCFECFL
jgi:hypothetical protein